MLQVVPLSELATPRGVKAGKNSNLPVYSVTKHNGFVPSLEYFNKQVFSRDLADYKLVEPGELAYATIHLDEGSIGLCPERCLISPMYTTFRVNEKKVDATYLCRFLKSPKALAQYPQLGKGSVERRRAISFERLSKLEIPLPSLAEQRRIAEVLDKAEALRAKRRAALAQLDSLTQFLFLDLFGDPVANPKGWPRGTLGEVATFVGGGTPSRARPEFFEGTICWATSKDMKSEFLDDTQEHITNEAIQQSATNLVPAGTALIVVKSKILAHSLPIAIARVPTCFGQDLKGMTVSERADVGFVTAALRCGKRWLLERTRGLNTEGLTLDHLRAFPLPIPPLDLQHEFARRVAAVEKLKTAQRAALAELDALFASLQHRAFRGEL